MKRWMTLVLLTAAGGAWAHPGHGGDGLAAGLLHPLVGLDHWMAMLGLGLWSRAAGVPVKALASVGAALAAGAFLQPGLPAVEPLLAASVLVAGLMGIGAARLPAWLGLALAGAFSLAHGQAHGHELAGAGAALGAIAASLALMGAGWLLGSSRRLLRAAPAVVALAGTGLLSMV
jgi:urease accessory protein